MLSWMPRFQQRRITEREPGTGSSVSATRLANAAYRRRSHFSLNCQGQPALPMASGAGPNSQSVTSMTSANPVIDFESYRNGARKTRLYYALNQCTPLSRAAPSTSPTHSRIELRVEIGNLASSLIQIRRWLVDHGCSSQVFHCVREGSEAVIRLEFDMDSVGLVRLLQRDSALDKIRINLSYTPDSIA